MYKITIDPGHGGNDPGAVGNNLRECDINLSVALKVKGHLERHGVSVQMTRLTDRTVSLDERTNMANKWGADALISIHCNSASFTAYGIETFAYQPIYRKLADAIHHQLMLDQSLYYTNRGVKFADFHMLRESAMAAALVEMAFISNYRDAELLAMKQEEFAVAIAKGILGYFNLTWEGGTSNPVPAPKPPAPSPSPKKVDVYYKAYVGGRWLPEVKNLTDYAGLYGQPITAVECRLTSGDIEYRTANLKQNYYLWVKNNTDYAGDKQAAIDRLQIFNGNIRYRVHILGGSWLPWVRGMEDYAGIVGKKIDGIQIEVI